MATNLSNLFNSISKNSKMGDFQDLDHIDGVSISTINANLYLKKRDDLVLFYFRKGANHASVYTQSKLISENIILEPFELKKEEDLAQNIPKIKKTTKKSTYKLGKIKAKNRVGVFIKNRDTQKNIKHEVSLLKQKSIQDIKNHLRSKNLIKVGSDAPNDVLRKMYEDSILSGEITNINNNNMVYNYLNE